MRILVVGSGGGEHALVWKLRQSPRVREVVCAPGNAGIERHARVVPIASGDSRALSELALREKIDLVVVGPEAPLAAGLADDFAALRIPVLGPSRAAARLEASKVFAKQFMARHRIPTAAFSVHVDAAEARARLDSSETRYPLVVKADGLAAGKGVVVARTRAEAREAIERIMVAREFGTAGDAVVLEECLEGREASFIVFTDGEAIAPAVPAEDHKTVYDGDRGPNTGGMGAVSTDAILGPELEREILSRVIRPAVQGMAGEGTPFRGILYAGLMLTPAGPRVLEFNARMGDPEAQVILPRLSSDFAVLCEALCRGQLDRYSASWTAGASVCVVAASAGYPGPYEKEKPIAGLEMAEEDPRVLVFHSGTRRSGHALVTDGGRVLGVTAVAGDLEAAVAVAYEAVNKIRFDGMHCRRDIGARGRASMRGGEA